MSVSKFWPSKLDNREKKIFITLKKSTKDLFTVYLKAAQALLRFHYTLSWLWYNVFQILHRWNFEENKYVDSKESLEMVLNKPFFNKMKRRSSHIHKLFCTVKNYFNELFTTSFQSINCCVRIIAFDLSKKFNCLLYVGFTISTSCWKLVV